MPERGQWVRPPWVAHPEAETAKANYLKFALQQTARFWANTRRSASGCLEWTAGLDKDGYGKFAVSLPRREKNRQQQCHVRAHRLAFEIVKGPVPSGLLVLHSCDNPKCVEPEHLSVGTQKLNREQAVARGRTAKGPEHAARTIAMGLRGERHPGALLTVVLVRRIRALKLEGCSAAGIARMLKVSTASVYQVLSGKTWRSVE